MTFPAVERQISSRDMFTSVLREVKRCIADGSLRQVKPAAAPFARDDVTSVPDEGPWPDYVEAYFEDRSGQRYKLTVETYHGAGGSWEKV
ncbi:MAG: hypothetical protein AB1586_21295 [Pseudomonadota bacterium]